MNNRIIVLFCLIILLSIIIHNWICFAMVTHGFSNQLIIRGYENVTIDNTNVIIKDTANHSIHAPFHKNVLVRCLMRVSTITHSTGGFTRVQYLKLFNEQQNYLFYFPLNGTKFIIKLNLINKNQIGQRPT